MKKFRTKGKNYVSEKAVVDLFPENKQFGEQIFKFMQLIAETSDVSCDTFLQTGEFFRFFMQKTNLLNKKLIF